MLWKFLRNNQTKSEASRQLSSLKKLYRKFSGKSFTTERIMKAHNYTEYELCHWCFSRNFCKIFRTSILKENIPIDVPYFFKEHHWTSSSNEATIKKSFGRSKPSSKLTLKQYRTTVVAASMNLEIVNKWRSVLQINILKKKLRLWTRITFH